MDLNNVECFGMLKPSAFHCTNDYLNLIIIFWVIYALNKRSWDEEISKSKKKLKKPTFSGAHFEKKSWKGCVNFEAASTSSGDRYQKFFGTK